MTESSLSGGETLVGKEVRNKARSTPPSRMLLCSLRAPRERVNIVQKYARRSWEVMMMTRPDTGQTRSTNKVILWSDTCVEESVKKTIQHDKRRQ